MKSVKNIILLLSLFLLITGCRSQESRVISTGNRTIINYTPKIDFYQGKDKSIRIYLPPSYNASDKNYPVIYLMDGQNIFYDSTSYVGEWHVDESMDLLIKDGYPETIIVGVDHGNERRLMEYNPYDHPNFGVGEGKEYTEWMVNKLIPEIEANFRIKNSKNTRGIGGASMGGLISLYAIQEYPAVFGHAALFSVSFPIAPDAIELIKEIDNESKVYFVTGEKEGNQMVTGVMVADSILNAKSFDKNNYFTTIVPNAEHNEMLWETAFVDYYKWISSKW